jgi:arylsulfatase A-like enzyme
MAANRPSVVSGSQKPGALHTLLLALVFSLAFMGLALADLYGEFRHLASGDVMSSIGEQIRSSPIVRARIIVGIAKIVALHLAFGVVAWSFSRLTLVAFPSLGRRAYFVVAGWCVTLAFLVGLANAELFPWSRTGKWSRTVEDFLSFPVPLWPLLAAALGALLGTMMVVCIRRTSASRHMPRFAAWSAVLLMLVITLQKLPMGTDESDQVQGRTSAPNIVLIGIDSLRPDLVGRRDQVGYTPSLTAFTEAGHRFVDATTPLARTFPSWIAMLTGKRPITTGIRENLLSKSMVDVTTIADILAEAGYQTVYATDEVRFSNIDTSYGFESTLTPRIGVTDFLLGGLTDFPLTNLVANTRVGNWLFPDTYANRAAAVTYDPQTFVDRIDRNVRRDGRPVFLAMHLTLPHFPYRWRAEDDSVFSRAADSAYAYLSSVVEVDRQFAAITRVLEAKGLLDNTLVVVFSDHGEGLNLPADREVLFEAAAQGIDGVPIWSAGHGNTVLSDSQFEIFMAARAFGVPGFGESKALHSVPVSIEDVAPTVLDVAGIPVERFGFDGYSFASLLRGTGTKAEQQFGPGPVARIRFTESAYTTPALQEGAADDVTLMKESVGFYRMNNETGWIEFNDKFWPYLLQIRERAAIGPTKLLAALPARQAGYSSFILVPRTGGLPVRLMGRPDPATDAEASALWDALAREYEGEIGAPAP